VRRAIPHDLMDVADPRQDFSAGEFARRATQALEEAARRGEVPIIAGGTGLYIRALLCGIAPMPPRDEALRQSLYARARGGSPEELHAELRLADPAAAARIGTNDLQRIVRALEVVTLTGRTLSEHIRAAGFAPGRLGALKVGLTARREELHRRIDERVEGIFAQGLVAEVEGLLSSGVPEGCNAMKALGYREVLSFLAGRTDLAAVKELVARNTRRYAKRQMTWFRREPEVHWFDIAGGAERLEAIAGEVEDLWRRSAGAGESQGG
jgi:tRNA dimethylallyltransferase